VAQAGGSKPAAKAGKAPAKKAPAKKAPRASRSDAFSILSEPALHTTAPVEAVDEQARARQLAEEQRRVEEERRTAEDAARAEANRKAQEQKEAEALARAVARLQAQERKEAEARARAEARLQAQEQKDAEARARIEAKRKAQERKDAEARARAEAKRNAQERKEAEARARAEAKRKEEAERKTAAAPADPPPDVVAPAPSLPRILIVDDDDQLRGWLDGLLSRSGWVVSGAATGDAAIERYDADQPHLVVLDQYMPGMGGLDVARHIRATNSEVRLLMFSASDAPKVLDEAERLSVHFVSKINIDGLLQQLETLQSEYARSDVA
jgi:CheY-like chemotaxis protein